MVDERLGSVRKVCRRPADLAAGNHDQPLRYFLPSRRGQAVQPLVLGHRQGLGPATSLDVVTLVVDGAVGTALVDVSEAEDRELLQNSLRESLGSRCNMLPRLSTCSYQARQTSARLVKVQGGVETVVRIQLPAA